jgi:hypothetical protein
MEVKTLPTFNPNLTYMSVSQSEPFNIPLFKVNPSQAYGWSGTRKTGINFGAPHFKSLRALCGNHTIIDLGVVTWLISRHGRKASLSVFRICSFSSDPPVSMMACEDTRSSCIMARQVLSQGNYITQIWNERRRHEDCRSRSSWRNICTRPGGRGSDGPLSKGSENQRFRSAF